MSKTTNSPADDRVAVLEREMELMRETHRAEMEALRADIRNAKTHDGSSAAQEIADSIKEVLAPQAARLASVDPAEFAKRAKARDQELCNAADGNLRAAYQDLFTGERGFTLHILEPQSAGRGLLAGRESPPKPFPGMGAVVFASSAAAAEAKYRTFFGIRELFDGRVLTCQAIEPQEKAERIRAALLKAIEDQPTKAKAIMERIAVKAAVEALPKMPDAVGDELAELLT